MTRHDEHDDVRRALHDAVDSVEPGSGLDAIRARTAKPAHPRRPWVLGAFGAAVATAAVAAAVAVLGQNPSTPSADENPVGSPTASSEPSPTGTPDEASSPAPVDTGGLAAVPVYYAGDTPQGTRLYREFVQGDASAKLLTAVDRAVSAEPLDPDYRTLWPAGTTVADASVAGGTITVDLTGAPHDLPAGMTAEDASLAIQQVVYSAQAAVGGRLPVQLLLDGGHTDAILGQPTSEPLSNAPQVDVVALVGITEPEQGAEEGSGRLQVTGVANSFEANVPLQVRRGDEVVLEDFTTAEGWGDRLFAWTKTLDISSLPPGDYTLVAMTDDPSNGEGGGPQVDTKDFTVPG